MDSPEPAAAAAAAIDVAGTVRAATLMTVASGAVGVGNLVFSVIVAHNGGAAAYGAASSLLTVAAIAGLLAMGIQFTIVRAVATGSLDGRAALRAGLRVSTPWMSLAVVLVVLSPLVVRFLQLPDALPVFLAAVLYVLMLGLAVPGGILFGQCRFQAIAALMTLNVLLRLLFGALLTGGDHAVSGALLASILAVAASGIPLVALASAGVRKGEPVASRRAPRQGMTGEGMLGSLAALSIWMLWLVPLLAARHTLPGAEAGDFAAVQAIVGGVLSLGGSCASVFFPVIARHTSMRIASISMVVMGAFVAICGLVLTVAGPVMVHRVYGPTFAVSAALLGATSAAAVVVAVLAQALWAGRALRRFGRPVAEIIGVALVVDTVISAVGAHSVILLGAAPGIAVVVAAALCTAMRIVVRRRAVTRPASVDASAELRVATMAGRRRILMLNWKDPDQPGAGGAERYISRTAELWAAAGVDVTVLVPRARGAAATERRAGVTYLGRGNRHTVFGEARRHLMEHGDAYDQVVESISTRPFFAHECVNRRAWAIYHQIADDVWQQEFRFPVNAIGRYALEPWWLRRMSSAQVIAVSESTAADLDRHGVRTLAVVPPGCDGPELVSPRHRGDRAPRLVFIGRLVRAKRPADALEAFSLIRHRYPDAVLDVIGDGYLRSSLRAVPGSTVHGWLDEQSKAALLANADLVLIPGTREGWGIVAIEAALHGIPVVAYDIPGLRDAVLDGHTGVLVQPSPSALVEAALDLLADRGRWSLLSEAARQRARELTWAATASRLAAVMWDGSCRSSSAA